jgi:hypothetical protein
MQYRKNALKWFMKMLETGTMKPFNPDMGEVPDRSETWVLASLRYSLGRKVFAHLLLSGRILINAGGY